MNDSMKNPKAWVEVLPDVLYSAYLRNADNYVATAKQFEVETNPRYVPGHDGSESNGRETYCNIFLWDVTNAACCEIPHWVDPITGVKVPMGKGKETSANGVCDWLAGHGLEQGWMQCGELQARKRASLGYPTVGAWKNPSGIGHVCVVLPGSDFTHIAQAGSNNLFDKPIASGYGNLVSQVKFYTHD